MSPLRPIALVAALAFVLTSATPSPAQKPLGPPDYTKITGFVENATLPTEEPLLLWKLTSATVVRGDGTSHMVGFTTPVVADGVVYLADELGQVFAVQAADGAEIWKHEHGTRISTEPAIDADHVYFGSERGITALRRDNGREVWHHAVGQGANETTPLPIDGRVYVSAYDGKAYALDRATGRLIWAHDFAGDAPPDQPGFEGQRARLTDKTSRPRGAACDGKIFVQCVFDQSRLIAVDCRTGQRLWSFQAGGWTGGAPTIVNDRVYVNSQDKHLYCLDRGTGKVLWKFMSATWLSSQPAVHDGKVFQPGSGGRLYQLDAESGRLIQTFEPDDEAERKGSVIYSFPLVANGMACYGTGRGGLVYAVDIATGKLRWKLCPAEKSEIFTDPATDGRRIFVTTRQDNNKAGECALFAIGADSL